MIYTGGTYTKELLSDIIFFSFSGYDVGYLGSVPVKL